MNVRRFENCSKHGNVVHVLESRTGYWRCQRCRNDHVIEYRRRAKQKLISLAGGKCLICGYSKHWGSLQFHHLDPSKKKFGIASNGMSRSFAKSHAETLKCVLLCANCHQEVEDGIVNIPRSNNSSSTPC